MSTADSVWRKVILSPDRTIRDAIANLNDSGLQIVLVLDDKDRLLGTVTDGDIRRALLRGLQMEAPIAAVMSRDSLVVPLDMSRDMVEQLMRANKLRQLPAVDDQRRVIGLNLWHEEKTEKVRPNQMVIMAGGLGRRLRPYTENCPKPMLEVAGKPMLQHIIERAKEDGFRHFVLTVHYLGQMIEDYFGDGSRCGVQIAYLREEAPLGTAGALGLLDPCPDRPFVVSNGDVLTDLRYGELLDFHCRYSAAATMAVRLHEWQNPFGVVRTRGVDIVGFEEKPMVRSHINAGVYALSPSAVDVLQRGESCDMPTLFVRLQEASARTIVYPMHEPWLDVGRGDDLNRARAEHMRADGEPQ